MYAIQGLWTAARESLPIVFIIVNNRAYAALDEFGRHFRISKPVGPRCRHRLRRLARDMAARQHVDTRRKLATALRDALASPDATLFDVQSQLSVIVPGHSLALRHPLVVDPRSKHHAVGQLLDMGAGSPATGSARQEPGAARRVSRRAGAPVVVRINMSRCMNRSMGPGRGA